jgi:hypothetical protein
MEILAEDYRTLFCTEQDGWRDGEDLRGRVRATTIPETDNRGPFPCQGKEPRHTDSNVRVTTLMHDLLVHPEDFSKHIDRATASLSSIAMFGHRAKSHDDF